MLLNIKTLIITGLRGGTLFAKLIFTIVLARYLSIDDFGRWVLVTAVVTYGIFGVGAELYNITLRNLISHGQKKSIYQISLQSYYFIFIYIIIILIGIFIQLATNRYSEYYMFIVALILIFEHFTHEFHRLAFFQDHQVHANAILFIKSAAWMIPAGLYIVIVPSTANLFFVLNCWLVGAISAAVYSIVFYRQIFLGVRPNHIKRFSGKFRQGFAMLAPFLVIAVALRTPLVLDRYLIERFFGPAQLGAYGYYATFGNGVQAIFDAVILARLTPRLLQEKRGREQQVQIVGLFVRQSILFWIFSIVALYITVPYLNTFIRKDTFDSSFSLLILLLIGQMAFSLASVLHYGLYSLHRDHQLAKGAVVYMMIAVTSYAVLIPLFGNYGAAAALAFSAAALLGLRAFQLLRDETA
jgi:O-antigen/teichoic acid export membrane protein